MRHYRNQIKQTPERLALAQKMRAGGKTYNAIAKEIGLSCGTMAKRWLEPGYAEICRQRIRKYRQSVLLPSVPRVLAAPRLNAHAEETARDLARLIPPDTRDLTARLCGDPLPGRRAIDRIEMKRGKHEVPFQ